MWSKFVLKRKAELSLLPLSISVSGLPTMTWLFAEVDCTGVSSPVADAGWSETIAPPPETGGSVTIMAWEVAMISPLRISWRVNVYTGSQRLVNVSPQITSDTLNGEDVMTPLARGLPG